MILRRSPRSAGWYGLALVVGALLSPFSVDAGDTDPITFWERIEDKGLYDRIWDKFRFYENEENPFIQEVSLIGRYQGQYWAVDANQGRADDWENRRMYLGLEALFLHQVRVQAQIRVSEDFDPFYDGLYQALVEWQPNENFTLGVGRLDFLMAGLERSVSSARIVTFERGLLVNQLMPGEVVGAIVEGNWAKLTYRAGLFSGSINDEFTDFAGGFGAAAGLGYELPLFYEQGRLHLDYLFNNGNPSNNAFEPYDHVVSLWHQGNLGRFGLGLDATWAHGLDGRPAVFGITVLPTYLVATNLVVKRDALQVVLRYQFAMSDGDNGLQLQPRYEQDIVPDGFGDHYQAVYAGLNYLIYGDRLKLMSGIEYSHMTDAANDGGAFEGVTYLAGVRLYF